ncbi:MAG: hypothetical protein N2C14_12600, partial [Planctomycetales bacterium]
MSDPSSAAADPAPIAEPAAETGQYSSWRNPRENPVQRVKARHTLRWVVAVSAVLLFACWIYFVAVPFFAPRVKMVYLPITGYEVLSDFPVPYAEEDADGLASDSLKAVLKADPKVADGGPRVLRTFQTAAELDGLSAELQDAAAHPSDVLIFYLRAHGVSENGKPYLLCANYNPANPSSGRYPLEDVLRQARECRARNMLLILDAGGVDSDPRMGMVVNDFPRLLQKAARKVENRKVWILCSHSPLEHSHAHHGWKRSVFGYFVAKGLEGAADYDDNSEIDLEELFHFVSANVSSTVARATNSADTQTPMLLCAGLNPKAFWPPSAKRFTLLPTRSDLAGEYADDLRDADDLKGAQDKVNSAKEKEVKKVKDKAPKTTAVNNASPTRASGRGRFFVSGRSLVFRLLTLTAFLQAPAGQAAASSPPAASSEVSAASAKNSETAATEGGGDSKKGADPAAAAAKTPVVKKKALPPKK